MICISLGGHRPSGMIPASLADALFHQRSIPQPALIDRPFPIAHRAEGHGEAVLPPDTRALRMHLTAKTPKLLSFGMRHSQCPDFAGPRARRGTTRLIAEAPRAVLRRHDDRLATRRTGMRADYSRHWPARRRRRYPFTR